VAVGALVGVAVGVADGEVSGESCGALGALEIDGDPEVEGVSIATGVAVGAGVARIEGTADAAGTLGTDSVSEKAFSAVSRRTSSLKLTSMDVSVTARPLLVVLLTVIW
jgi:hypothetical protein